MLMQQIGGLVSLRALHIIQLRNDDTCVWVMRETKRFLVDNLSHHPHLRLEWVSIDEDNLVERVVNPAELVNKPPKKKSKGKEKATGLVNSLANFPALLANAWDNAEAAANESDSDDELMSTKFQLLEGARFSDVWDVRIFQKEVISGRI